MRRRVLAAALTIAFTGACANEKSGTEGPDSAKSVRIAAGTAAASDRSAPCPENGPRLVGSGICKSEAAKFMTATGTFDPPEECKWSVSETETPDGWLIYRALECKGRTTTLEYGGGAHQAELTYAVSAYNGDGVNGMKVASMILAEPDAKSAILTFARAAIDDPREAAGCAVRPASIEGWAADAMVVDISAAEAAKLPNDEIRSACGPFGLDQGEAAFWRSVGPYAIFFTLGQDAEEIDAASMTLIPRAE